MEDVAAGLLLGLSSAWLFFSQARAGLRQEQQQEEASSSSDAGERTPETASVSIAARRGSRATLATLHSEASPA